MDKEVVFVLLALPMLALWAVLDWVRTSREGRRRLEPSWVAAVAYLVPFCALYVLDSPPWFTAIFLLVATVAIWAGAVAAVINHVRMKREHARIEAERAARKLAQQGISS